MVRFLLSNFSTSTKKPGQHIKFTSTDITVHQSWLNQSAIQIVCEKRLTKKIAKCDNYYSYGYRGSRSKSDVTP